MTDKTTPGDADNLVAENERLKADLRRLRDAARRLRERYDALLARENGDASRPSTEAVADLVARLDEREAECLDLRGKLDRTLRALEAARAVPADETDVDLDLDLNLDAEPDTEAPSPASEQAPLAADWSALTRTLGDAVEDLRLGQERLDTLWSLAWSAVQGREAARAEGDNPPPEPIPPSVEPPDVAARLRHVAWMTGAVLRRGLGRPTANPHAPFRKALEDERDALKAREAALTAVCEEHTAELARLRPLETERDALSRRLERAEAERDALLHQDAQNDRQEDDADLRALLDAERDRSARLEAVLGSLRAQVTRLAADLAVRQGEAAAACETAATLRQVLADRNAELSVLYARMEGVSGDEGSPERFSPERKEG